MRKGAFAKDRRQLGKLGKDDAEALVDAFRTEAKPVPPLQPMGANVFHGAYAKATGPVRIGGAALPAIVEVWSMT